MRNLLLATAATMGALLATAGGAKAQPVKPVAPGTIVVHMNGYLQFEIADFGSTYNTVKSGTGAYKLNPVSTDGDVRLYPGFDAQTVSGIDYGVQVETRVTTSNAGKAANGNGSPSSSGSSGIYIRRAYGYLGTPEAGFGRFGQTDSVFGLMQTGVIEAFGDGGQWNDDGGPQQILPTAAAPGQFIYGDQGALYATDKIVYISPAFSGFSAGVGYEPNSNGLRQGYANNATASSTSAALSSSPVYSDVGSRRKNTIDAAAQYVLKANGFNSKFSVGYIHSAPIGYNGPAATQAASTTAPYGYDDMSVFEVGGQTTYAGVTVGANIKTGAVEDAYSFKPKGGRDALTYIIGANYVLGPYVIGASFFDGQSSGGYTPVTKKVAKTLTEYGVAVGGNYVIGKDMSLFLQYLYGHRHQPGNTYGVVGGSNTGNAQVQLIAAGATFKW